MICKITVVITFACLSFNFTYATENVDDVPWIASHFGTKGRYEEVNTCLAHGKLAIDEKLISPQSSECRAVHLTAVIRHGTRYPTTKNVVKMRDFYNITQTQASDWKRNVGLSKWDMWYTEDMDGRLVEKGREDHSNLAMRLAKYFPTLFTEQNLRDGRIKFITSSKHRCVNSTIAFKTGLKRSFGIEDEEFDHEVNDSLMRFFDQCAKFVAEVERNKNALAEVELFLRGPEMNRTFEKIADRLQVPYSVITPDRAESAFYFCAYEFAIKSHKTSWCQLFDHTDAQVMEYAADLKQYWKRSYGHDINSKSSCVLFHDLFNRLDKATSDNGSGQSAEAVTVQVGHAETLLPLLTLLGLFRDVEPLTSRNFANQTERAFRTGRIVPYAGNLVLVLHRCPTGIHLETRLNEQPLTLPGMSSPMPLYEEVKQHYAHLLQGCDQQTECALPAI